MTTTSTSCWNEDKMSVVGGAGRSCETDLSTYHKKPLFLWAKSFDDAAAVADRGESFKAFVTGNALSYALEYIGLVPDSEQSSLHLSAIFEEESLNQSKKFPIHYESETKNRIQSLNRMYVELLNYYEDHFSQLVAFPPPNSVHIVSECRVCGVQELEKLLTLMLGAAVQGGQQQDTIKKMKKFPSEVQEALIESIKMIKDHPEVLHLKSWIEFEGMTGEQRQKMYEAMLVLVRRLLLERNQRFQTQLMADYFAGYVHCGQRRSVDGRGDEDPKLSAALRQLKEDLNEKTELLQECREELEVTKNRVEELQSLLNDTQDKLKTYKKARDEIDALREGHDKAIRLENELERLKNKLRESKQFYDRAEHLENENRSLQLENESLLEQNSFLTIEKESLKMMLHNESLTENPSPVLPLQGDLASSFEVIEDEAELQFDDEQNSRCESELRLKSPILEVSELERSQTSELPKLCNECSQTEESGLGSLTTVNSSDFSQQTPEAFGTEEKSQHVAAAVLGGKTSHRKKKSLSVISSRKNKKTYVVPFRGAQKLLPALTEIGNLEKQAAMNNFAIKIIKVCPNSPAKRKCCNGCGGTRTKSPKRRSPVKKAKAALEVEHDADEELSISPNGLPNLSDLENYSSPLPKAMNGTHRAPRSPDSKTDSDEYFTCSKTALRIKTEAFQDGPADRYQRTEKSHMINDDPSRNYINLTVPGSMQNHISCIRIPNGSSIDVDMNYNGDPKRHHPSANYPQHSPSTGSPDSSVNVNVSTVQNFTTNINLNLKDLVGEFLSENLHHQIPLENVTSPRKANFKVNSRKPPNSYSSQSQCEHSTSDDEDSLWYEYGCV